MANWKCRHCNYECKKPTKNCKRCNSYNPAWREEDRHLDNNHRDTNFLQDADMLSFVDQESDELIWIKDSIKVTVHTTDTQAAVSLQAGLQLAIALVISITVFDSDKGRAIAQDLFQEFDNEQTNRQKIIVKNSKDVNIRTSDLDLSVNIQALLQILVSLVARVDIF